MSSSSPQPPLQQQSPPQPRNGRVPVPSLAEPSVASAPVPRWVDRDPGVGSAAPDRLALRRVQVSTEGFSAVAEVVVTAGPVVHTGVADAVATPAGTHRALAAATARCLESASGGQLRLEVDGVQVEVVAGQPTVVVALSAVSSRGHDRLSGAALVREPGDQGRAVVHAVLAASNRRVALCVADHAGQRA
jgi:hypothetical protein